MATNDKESSAAGGISVITILDDLRSQLAGHIKTNEEQSFANDSLKAELERYKTQVQNLEQSKVKKDLEQLVFERNKRNADLEEHLVSLKQQLLQQVESNKSLKTESEKLKADNNALEESYLEELVWLRNTNKVVTELLQSYGQPVQTVPMLSKRPTFSTKDLHKSALGHRNPMVYDSEETLVQARVSRTKMLERMKDPLCKVSSKPINYANVNSLFDTLCLKRQLSREQFIGYQLNEVAVIIDENVSIKKRYQDLYQSKAESNSNVSSRAVVPEKPNVLAPGLYAMTPKYVPPQKRNNREANTPLPRKETISLVKKTNVCVNMSTGIKYVTEASKSKSKCEKKTHRNLPARSENVKRVDNPLRNLNKRNHVDSSLCCGVKNLNSVNAKNPKVKNDATVKQVWKATGKIFASVGSKWRPTGRKFTLGDTCPLTRITKPEVVPLEKSGSVSTSQPANNVIVTPRFSKKPLTSYKRKDRKLKDISTGSPPNGETKAVNDPVNVNDLSANQLEKMLLQLKQ
ncbi:hypothetical protein Tco_0088318 [Tanacetum coccineum]